MSFKAIIANTIKEIMKENPGVVKLASSSKGKKFDIEYNKAQKVAEKLGRSYYFGTDLKYEDQEDFHRTLKELLRVKRALKEIG